MRIGIFGGSFNPPHNMHKDIVTGLIEQNYLDKIICVPAGDNYNKSYLLPIKDRIKMLELMFKFNENIEVSDIESEGSKYTLETLDYYQKLYPNDEIYFICGMDNLMDLPKWHRYEQILSTYKLIVVKRESMESEEAKELQKKFADNIEIANIEPRKISSTFVRREVMGNGISKLLKECMDDDVLEYLKGIEYVKYWNNIKI